MDRYGARGELLAAQHETILGPFLVGPGVDRAYEIGPHETIVYEHGRTYTERTPRITDERFKLTREQWADIMAKSFYDGFYHDCPEAFFDEVETMKSPKCRGEISIEWILWLSWARGIIVQVMKDPRR